MTTSDERTVEFGRHRETLFAIAYRILGSVADTEDVLQETWLSWTSAPRDDVVNARAFLVRIAVNESLRRLGRAHRRHEAYIGPWLPEPLVDADDASVGALRRDDVSMALMVVLETLTPLERAVFVLREAFGYEHAEIAGILGRSPAAVRQLSHRAREHVQARRPRFRAEPAVHREVTERFLAATLGGDLPALMDLLAPDVRLWTDAGGARRAALNVIEGRGKVLRLITGLHAGGEIPVLETAPVVVNGEPGVELLLDGLTYGVLVLELTDDAQVAGIYGLINPDKLGNLTSAANRTTSDGEGPGAVRRDE